VGKTCRIPGKIRQPSRGVLPSNNEDLSVQLRATVQGTILRAGPAYLEASSGSNVATFLVFPVPIAPLAASTRKADLDIPCALA